jgi:hypothetical protein
VVAPVSGGVTEGTRTPDLRDHNPQEGSRAVLTRPARSRPTRQFARLSCHSVPPSLPPYGHNQLVAAGLGVGAAASGLVWATGRLAGLAFGHTWLELDPAQVAGVLVQLRHHLDDPALAWPTSAQQALPAPLGYTPASWPPPPAPPGRPAGSCGCGNAPAWATQPRPAPGPSGQRPDRPPGPLPGSSARSGSGDRSRVILGRTDGAFGRLLAAEDCHSVLVFGPPGSFMTAGVVISAILEWTGPVLAASVKPDVIKATRAHGSAAARSSSSTPRQLRAGRGALDATGGLPQLVRGPADGGHHRPHRRPRHPGHGRAQVPEDPRPETYDECATRYQARSRAVQRKARQTGLFLLADRWPSDFAWELSSSIAGYRRQRSAPMTGRIRNSRRRPVARFPARPGPVPRRPAATPAAPGRDGPAAHTTRRSARAARPLAGRR